MERFLFFFTKGLKGVEEVEAQALPAEAFFDNRSFSAGCGVGWAQGLCVQSRLPT